MDGQVIVVQSGVVASIDCTDLHFGISGTLRGDFLCEIHAVLIVIGFSIVIIIAEAGLPAAREDVYRHMIHSFLSDIVLHVLLRNNGAFFDKHRNVGPRLAIEAVGNILAALINSAAIIVNPGAFRQIDPLHGLTTFCDRGNEQPLSKHPGIGVVSHVFVVGIAEQQGIHQPQTGVIGLPLIRIHVRDQGIPLLNGGLGHFFRRCTKVPRLALLMICSMDAENRTHRSELQPSGVELRTGVFNVPGVLVEAAAIAAPLGLPVIDGGQHRSLLLI